MRGIDEPARDAAEQHAAQRAVAAGAADEQSDVPGHAQQHVGGVVDVDLRFDLDAGRERVQRGARASLPRKRGGGPRARARAARRVLSAVGASSALEGWSAAITRSFAFARPASMCATARAAWPSGESTKPTAIVSRPGART